MISRKLKNWAAHRQPPVDSRKRLLHAAALQAEFRSATEPEKPEARVNLFWEILDFVSAPMPDEAVRPFTVAGMWSIHMTVASLRFML